MVHSRNGRLPVRLVMMNSAKQVRIRCRVIRHHTRHHAAADLGDRGGNAGDGDDDREADGQGGVVGQVNPAGDQAQGQADFGGPPPQGAQHRPGDHQRGDDDGGGQADGDPREQGQDGVPFAGQHGGGQQADGDPQIQNTILALRTAERRTGSSMTVTVPPERRPVRPPRLDLGMVQPPPNQGVCAGKTGPGRLLRLVGPGVPGQRE